MTAHATPTLNANCPQCHGRGWVIANSWPIECTQCVPTKTLRGKVVLDHRAIAERKLRDRRKPIPVVEARPWRGPHLFVEAQDE